MSNGYEKIYQQLMPKLAACDFREASRRLGLELLGAGKDGLSVHFLGRDYAITAAGVEPLDSFDVHVNNRSILAYYAISKGIGLPTGRFHLLYYFADMASGSSEGLQWMNAPLYNVLNGDYKRFCYAARQLDGIDEDLICGKGHVWRFEILPRIIARTIFYEADEEFPSEIRIFYDEVASDYLAYECLAFLNACFITSLTITAKTGYMNGWVEDNEHK